MVSWPRMSLGHLVTEEEGTYLDHCEEDTSGTENGLGWGDT